MVFENVKIKVVTFEEEKKEEEKEIGQQKPSPTDQTDLNGKPSKPESFKDIKSKGDQKKKK